MERLAATSLLPEAQGTEAQPGRWDEREGPGAQTDIAVNGPPERARILDRQVESGDGMGWKPTPGREGFGDARWKFVVDPGLSLITDRESVAECVQPFVEGEHVRRGHAVQPGAAQLAGLGPWRIRKRRWHMECHCTLSGYPAARRVRRSAMETRLAVARSSVRSSRSMRSRPVVMARIAAASSRRQMRTVTPPHRARMRVCSFG